MATLRKVEVEWVDSVLHGSGWMSASDATEHDDLTTCHTVGYVLKNDKKNLVLCNSVHLGNVAGVTTIPKSAVRSITTL